ncbi:hypothetical protein L210DRAFT_3561370 [Boletus edulis BED1]|uniref:Uncharacterized protein n=1 Tax=Boletus edulis BED1 TaxID=1328754 RepID=A0AAD4BIH8_BOLED|nr:hypothetical protein L210DRAFT_3561370 [Boletus edulis BED1]
MLTGKPYYGPRKLVLAFDVGTTYSGISYCILRPGEIPKIDGVTRFPGQADGHGSAKVPSILYYDTSGNVKAVGYEALSRNTMDDAEEHAWEKAEWWKLHLRPKHLASAHIKDDDLPTLPSGKSAVDILTDFIKYLFECARTHIQEHHIGLDWTSTKNSIEFIFSHPNGWEGAQQQKYREAIEGAGLIPRTREGRSQVHMVTEGEASLHYCISGLPEERADSKPQAIVIIDAGGGTIDLSAYSVTCNPVVCEEIAPAECRLQGAVFVTRRASTLLKRKLEGSPHCNNEEIEDFTRKFDETTKLGIRSRDEAAYLTIGGLRYNNPQFNIKRGALRLSGEEATSLFYESIKAIIDAFDQQRKAFNTRLTMAFLVGGLGANDFVWSRLKSHFKEQGIDVCRPDNYINKAVANGAVIFHIDRAVKSRVARATYGVPYSPWVDESDPEHHRRRHQWRKSASGRYLVDGGFCPILLKGNQVDEQKEIRHSFCFMNRHQAEFGGEQMNIMCYRGQLPHPRWLDEDSSSFAGLGTIQANLSKVANNQVVQRGISGETYYQVDFDVVAFFGSTELTAQMAWKHNGIEERTPVTIAYYDD